MGVKSRAGRHGQAALSGSKPKAPGSAGGYLLSVDCGVSDLNADAVFGPFVTLLGHEVRVFVAMHATNTPNLLYSVRDP